MTGETGIDSTKSIGIMLQLKYLSNFWKTFKSLLINYEIDLNLTSSDKWIIVAITVEN